MSSEPSAVAREVERADERIRPYLAETALLPSPVFGEWLGAEVTFKCEHLQPTGSFKVRGALNKLLSLTEQQRAEGVVAASTGNHGAAVAFAARTLATPCLVFVPETAAPTKVDAIERLGAEIRVFGTDPVEAERRARQVAAETGTSYLSPYNDLQVIAGQGTLAAELERQTGTLDAVIASLGGGGLVAGVAAYLKDLDKDVRVIGCSPHNSAVMIESLKAGRILELPSKPTLSDGTAGGIEPGSVTFELCQALVDEVVTLTEDEIRAAMRRFMDVHHQLIEGAAGVAVAAALKKGSELAGQRVAVVLCGSNISLADLQTVLCG
ncbi:MAG: threonine/serine dehydratase [Trueperaceae bacterium]|nr:MAG: threonine/serine dehydratase [Trueperaceae bacterium]